MTFDEIVEKLEELNITPEDLESDSRGHSKVENNKLEKIFGEISLAESISNPDNSEVRVFYFVDHDVYIRITGYHSSYTGIHMDNDYTEVFEYERKSTFYATASEKAAMGHQENKESDSYEEDSYDDDSYSY